MTAFPGFFPRKAVFCFRQRGNTAGRRALPSAPFDCERNAFPASEKKILLEDNRVMGMPDEVGGESWHVSFSDNMVIRNKRQNKDSELWNSTSSKDHSTLRLTRTVFSLVNVESLICQRITILKNYNAATR
jgi:hypothetical protein